MGFEFLAAVLFAYNLIIWVVFDNVPVSVKMLFIGISIAGLLAYRFVMRASK